MFVLSLHKEHRVVLARFFGVVSSEDLRQLDDALAALVAQEGFMRGIFDFSSIEANAVPRSFLMAYARLPQTILMGQERVIVAPQPEVYELACAYAVQQRVSGDMEPKIVRDLADAYRPF